ncbi:phosphatidylinositol-specific phospholipase C [Diaporthe sp. PMI_573]|nr:phosphatidylinositol-specific phospholipase C [Diaporthaceae sp. PMI_573]
MASLTIRNVTVNPLELVLTERFERGPAHGGAFSRISGLFTTSSATTPALFAPEEGQEPSERVQVTGVVAGAFETLVTDIRPPEPGRSVLRLSFRAPGAAHTYVVDCPSPGSRSVVMRRVAEGEGGDDATPPLELTTVYTASAHHLSVLSSANLSRWMRELGDGWPLSALSVPGTHNSPTYHVALPSVRCQAVGVREQLDNGVRFLDVRVSASRGDGNDTLALVHSVFPVSLGGNRYLADLLDELYAFLDDNPSEALIISLKREGTGRGTDQHLSRHLFRRYCGGGGGDGKGGDGKGGDGKVDGKEAGGDDMARRWFTEPRIPSLGEARGKIVLVRRFNNDGALQAEHDGRGWGIDASAWPDNCADGTVDSGLVRVQDFYGVGKSAGIEKKAELARSHLERAGQQVFAAVPGPEGGPAPPPLFVNFLTASNFFNASCWPEKIAAKVNPSITEYLCVRHAEKGRGPAQLDVGDGGTGIVVTDWVGHDGDWDLTRCIVAWNARLQLK